jgi:hypothetical protein
MLGYDFVRTAEGRKPEIHPLGVKNFYPMNKGKIFV